MDAPQRSIFQTLALASGLLSQKEIDHALAALKAAAPAADASDQKLADKLVELGHLTGYQADQLLRGNRKLNLGLYRITDFIGQGGMGQVFKGEHTMMGRVVAIKVLPRSKSTPESITSFTREIRAQAALDHENLVRAFDAGHDGNVYFLVTEYVPGADLRKYVRNRGPLSMSEAATVISQAACGLEHAHTRGLIHRDVKPGNLLVTPDGHTKVSDLGLAGSLYEGDNDPRAGKIVGTADYLSPEQILTPREITPVSDVYSLGCTLYYAVTGKVPYPGGSTREKARRHCEDSPIHPRHFNPGLSDEFIEVVADMMEKDCKKRLTAAQVVRRLAKWSTEAVSLAQQAGLSQGAPQRLIALPYPAPPPFPPQTGPNFVEEPPIDPAQQEGLSQVSQGTDPVVSSGQETLPMWKKLWAIPRAIPRLPFPRITLPTIDPALKFVLGSVLLILLGFLAWLAWTLS